MFIYLWERQRQNASGLGAEREGDTESETGSRLWAVNTEPDVGSNPRAVRSWPELKSDAQPTEPPRRPSTTGFSCVQDCETMTWAEIGRSTNWATQEPLSNAFSEYTVMTMWFFIFHLCDILHCFSDVEPALHIWNKSDLVIVYSSFYAFLDGIC